MISRRAILIGNPGVEGSETYCDGVNVDIKNYKDFLLSPLGGSWKREELFIDLKPSLKQINEEINKLEKYDYSLIIFSGHGYYSLNHNSTILELNDFEKFDSKMFRNINKKRTLIFDCCREIAKIALYEHFEKSFQKTAGYLNFEKCRKCYDKRISECSSSLVVMWACKIDQTANDDSENGGYYLHSLLESAQEWQDENFSDLDDDHYLVFSVALAHDRASDKVLTLNVNQTPRIEKPKTNKFFPFAIIVK